MKKTIIIFLVCLCSGQMFAQNQSKQTLADSLYHEALDSLWSYRYKPAYDRYSAARDLYKEMNKPEYEFYCLLRMGDCADVFSDMAKSYFNYSKALKLAGSIDDEFRDLRHFLVYNPLKDVQENRDDWKDLLKLTYNLDSLVRYSSDQRLQICHKTLLAEKALQHNDSIMCEKYLNEADSLYKDCYNKDNLQYNISFNFYNDKTFIDSSSSLSIYRLMLFDYYYEIQDMIYDTYISYYCQFKDCEKAKEKAMNLIESRKERYPYYEIYYANLMTIGLLNKDSDMAYSALDSLKKGIEKSSFNYNDYLGYLYHNDAYIIDGFFKNQESEIDNMSKTITCLNSLYLSYHAYDLLLYDVVNDYIDFNLNNRDFIYADLYEYINMYYIFCNNRYGKYSSYTAKAYFYMGLSDESQNNLETALDYYSSSCDIYKELFSSSLKYLSSDNRVNVWLDYVQSMVNMICVLLTKDNITGDYTEKSYNTLLTLKGCLLTAEKSLAESVYESKDAELIKMYEEVQRSGLSGINSQSDMNQSHEKYSWDTEFLYKSSMLHYSEFLNIEYDSIRVKLQPNEYVVDFFDYDGYKKDSLTADSLCIDTLHQYVAYIYNKGCENPRLIKVFTEEELDSIKEEANVKSDDLHKLYSGEAADCVINLIWNPIKETMNIPEGATVFFVPSGSLHQLAIESLPIPGNYKFIRLSSAREVIERKPQLVIDKDRNPNAVLYGGLQYDVSSETMELESEKYKDKIPSFLAHTRGDDSKDKIIKGWLPLDGTNKEVNAVYDILKISVPNVEKYTGTEGTEESFLCLHDHAPQILLMSTHGFYYTPEDTNTREYLKGYTDAMSLSGLILSGGNRAWVGGRDAIPPGVLPGILTADKISQMNLKGLDLVVLSACQSGQGEVTPEGIYGLQRAFKKAGVGTILMTLWKVDDEATKIFIIEFFKNLIDNGWDKRNAFEKTKKNFQEGKEGSLSDYVDPYYWAGFVMLD